MLHIVQVTGLPGILGSEHTVENPTRALKAWFLPRLAWFTLQVVSGIATQRAVSEEMLSLCQKENRLGH